MMGKNFICLSLGWNLNVDEDMKPTVCRLHQRRAKEIFSILKDLHLQGDLSAYEKLTQK
jgi:hypothetical protein